MLLVSALVTESVQPKYTKRPLLPGTGAQVQELAIGPEALATGVVEANLNQGSRCVKMLKLVKEMYQNGEVNHLKLVFMENVTLVIHDSSF